jgi:hypothetical protein
MNILRQIDLGTVVSLIGCGLSCLTFAGILGTILHFLGTGIGLIASILHLVFSVVNGGPGVWCGCLVVMMVCGGCSVVTLAVVTILPSCGTAHAVNLCRFFGS